MASKKKAKNFNDDDDEEDVDTKGDAPPPDIIKPPGNIGEGPVDPGFGDVERPTDPDYGMEEKPEFPTKPPAPGDPIDPNYGVEPGIPHISRPITKPRRDPPGEEIDPPNSGEMTTKEKLGAGLIQFSDIPMSDPYWHERAAEQIANAQQENQAPPEIDNTLPAPEEIPEAEKINRDRTYRAEQLRKHRK